MTNNDKIIKVLLQVADLEIDVVQGLNKIKKLTKVEDTAIRELISKINEIRLTKKQASECLNYAHGYTDAINNVIRILSEK